MSYTVKGLTASNPPTTFTFEVRAVNANDESTASNQATATVDVPTSVFPTVTPGAGEVRVEWTTPANNGSAILKYQAWVFDDTNQIEITAYADIPGSDANTRDQPGQRRQPRTRSTASRMLSDTGGE